MKFNTIPIDMLAPGIFVEIDNSQAISGPIVMPTRVLVLGQKLAAGTVAPGAVTRITSDGQADDAYGKGSMLAAMLKAYLKGNPYADVRALAQEDPGSGVAATGTITLGGTVTTPGTLCLYIGGQAVRCAIAAGASTAAATAMATAINADTSLPVSASVSGSVVTLTARNKGLLGNQLDLRLNYYAGESLPAGLTASIAAMTGGTGSPDLAAVLAGIGDVWYTTIVNPYTDAANLTALENEMVRRWGGTVQRPGLFFSCYPGTHAAIATFGDGRNNQTSCIMGAQLSPTPPWCIAAIVAAADNMEPDPGRPRTDLPLAGMLPPSETQQYTWTERNLHLKSGISTFAVDAGGNCIIDRLVTTYKQGQYNAPDRSFQNVESMRILMYLAFSVRARVALKFPRCKLADDGTAVAPGSSVVTPATIKAELVALYLDDWQPSGLVENFEQFKRDLVVERDAANRDQVNAVIPPDIINQFRIFAAKTQFRL